MGPWPPNAEQETAHSCTSGGALDSIPALPNRLSAGWSAAGAIALFDGLAEQTLVLSPSAGFTTTQTGLSGPDDSQVLGFGPRGSLTAVPPGFGASTVAFAGRGVGATMRRWGLALMRKGGKDPDLWKTDFSMRYLGYTTGPSPSPHPHPRRGALSQRGTRPPRGVEVVVVARR